MSILYLEPGTTPFFPDPEAAEDGLIAVGGDLRAERLLHAYDLGVFPWFSEAEIPLWWSPDPRGVLEIENLHVSRRLGRTLARHEFALTWNEDFPRVVRECGMRRPEGTWIHAAVIDAYVELHDRGHAHSLEVWGLDGELVGGIYGVQRGGLFAAESKFYRRRDMSKVALVACVRSVFRAGIELFDVQFQTEYLATLGVTEWSRAEYRAEVARVCRKPVHLRGLVPRVGH